METNQIMVKKSPLCSCKHRSTDHRLEEEQRTFCLRCKCMQYEKKFKGDYNIEEIRKIVGELQKTLNWYAERSLKPYDWNTYDHPKIMDLLRLCKVDFDGHLKKQDKRGFWR